MSTPTCEHQKWAEGGKNVKKVFKNVCKSHKKFTFFYPEIAKIGIILLLTHMKIILWKVGVCPMFPLTVLCIAHCVQCCSAYTCISVTISAAICPMYRISDEFFIFILNHDAVTVQYLYKNMEYLVIVMGWIRWNKKCLKFQLIQILCFQVMHDLHVCNCSYWVE